MPAAEYRIDHVWRVEPREWRSAFQHVGFTSLDGGLQRKVGTLWASFTNATTTDATGYLLASTYGSGDSEVSEAHTWALLVAGVGLAGWIAGWRNWCAQSWNQ